MFFSLPHSFRKEGWLEDWSRCGKWEGCLRPRRGWSGGWGWGPPTRPGAAGRSPSQTVVGLNINNNKAKEQKVMSYKFPWLEHICIISLKKNYSKDCQSTWMVLWRMVTFIVYEQIQTVKSYFKFLQLRKTGSNDRLAAVNSSGAFIIYFII